MTRARWASALVLSLLLSSIAAAPAVADVRLVVQREDARAPEVVTVPAAHEDHALARLNADPHVRYAAPDVPVQAATDDPYWTHQWALEDPGSSPTFPYFGDAVEDADIDAQAAWDNPPDDGYQPVTVAVADTRIDTAHPDLAGQFSDLPAGPPVPNGPGCTAHKPDHGTAVAGVVAALHNTVGIAGVAPNARILSVPALDDCGGGSLSTVLAAFAYAADRQAQIVVASFSTDPLLPADRKAEIKQAFDDFFAANTQTLFVVAAGNEGNDNDTNPVYPCSSSTTAGNVLCVGRSDIDDSPSCRSNVGHHSVQLFAPGDRIWTTTWSNGQIATVGPQSGTSMSAPLVAGVAALAWFTAPKQATPEAAVAAVLDGVDGRDAMLDVSSSGGRLNAVGALGLEHEDLARPPAGAWQSCDPDHDGFAASADACPSVAGPGTPHGCPPDADGDGVPDSSDDCPTTVNANQANADGDAYGDACDATPRGPDSDGDGFPALDDRCPSQPGTVNGCPATAPVVNPPVVNPPVVNPPVVRPVPLAVVSVGVSAHRCRAHGRCSRTATVTVTLTRTAGTAVTVQKRVKRGHRWVWKRVLRRTLNATSSGRTLTVRRLGRGIYRVTASVTGAASKRRTFRI